MAGDVLCMKEEGMAMREGAWCMAGSRHGLVCYWPKIWARLAIYRPTTKVRIGSRFGLNGP